MFEILVVLLLIIANGVFSMSETSVVSSRRVRLQQRAAAGDHGATRALGLVDDPNVFLATVQIGITLIGILSGAFGGARLSKPVAELIDGVPGIGSAADTIAFLLVVALITYGSLVIGELLPKRIALGNPEGIASTVAGPMRYLSRAVAPFVHVLGVSTEALLKLLRIPASGEATITEEEVEMLLDQGAQAGVFHPVERDMAQRIFELADDRVTAHMTPRRSVAWIDQADGPAAALQVIANQPFSRFPVGDGSVDRLTGVVHARDMLLAGSDLDLTTVLRPPLVISESSTAFAALESFRASGEHLAVVIDEYRGMAGVISLQDILEAIVGNLPDSTRPGTPGVVQREDGSYLLDGGLPADDVSRTLGLPSLPGVDDGLYATLGGFVIAQLGHLPAIGESCDWCGWRFEVVDNDGHRVDQILATKIAD